MARGRAYLSPRLASAAALRLPLTLAGTPALAQTAPTDVKEDSVVLQPDKVADDAPVVETLAQPNLPSWSEDNARALLTFIRNVGEEGRCPKVYDTQELQAAIDRVHQIQLDTVAPDAFRTSRTSG